MMTTLADQRATINAIDDEIAGLFRRRMEAVAKVAEAKSASGMPVLDPARERDILSRVTLGCDRPTEDELRLLFTTMFGISRARQRRLLSGESPLKRRIEEACAKSAEFPSRSVVACPGAEGGYAQQAVTSMFALPTILYFNDFANVFEAVEKGFCPYGVLPIENSAAGSVASVYDLMQKHRFHIVRSFRLKVDHVLLACKGVRLDGIKRITSHPHALAQCGGFLRSHPGIAGIPGANTAVEAKKLAESGARDTAVIASRRCAELYGLEILADDIADARFNYTRFICISKNLEIYPDADRFSIMLSLAHRPGTLGEVISKFSSLNINLTKLESRPVPGMDFEFRFIFDFEAPPTDSSVLALLSELSSNPEIEHFTFLGAYAQK